MAEYIPLAALTSAGVIQALSRVLDSFKRDNILERDYELQANILKHRVALIESYRDAMILGNDEVFEWYTQLKDAMYVAVDALEAYEVYEATLDENKCSDGLSWTERLESYLWRTERLRNIFYTGTIHLFDSRCERQLGRTIQLINEKINGLLLVGRECGYHAFIESEREECPKLRPVPTSIPSDNYPILGRDKTEYDIIEKLKSCNKKESRMNLRVLPIVGMGGIGKTTLAQSIYNNNTLKEGFELTGWVFVSSQFHSNSILSEIMSEFRGSAPSSATSLPALTKALANVVEDKKFLLVLDDAWSKERSRWEEELGPLKRGKAGSKLIITTRDGDVVKAVDACHRGGVEAAVNLNGLGDEDTWRILAEHAFGEDKAELTESLEQIGKEIVKKLKGLPLAAKAIGRVLGNVYSESHWEKIRDSKLWVEMKSHKDGDLVPALTLTFLHLPPETKACFTYGSLFPKGRDTYAREVVYQWLAHDYLLDKDEKSAEDMGKDMINVLHNMSLVQSLIGSKFIQMHDLIHDMSTVSGRDDHLLVTDDGNYGNLAEKSIRHLCICKTTQMSKELAEKVWSCKMLRTLRVVGSWHVGDDPLKLEVSVLRTWFKQFHCLRVLVLRHLQINDELPEEIGELKHLRYLDLSSPPMIKLPNALAKLTRLQALILRGLRRPYRRQLAADDRIWSAEKMKIVVQLTGLRYLDLSINHNMETLPDAITALSNLRVLSLYACNNLKTLPDGIHKLERLECLELGACHRLEKLPEGLGSLSHLRELECDWEWDAHEIGRLAKVNIRRRLVIKNLGALTSKVDAQKIKLAQKDNLQELVLNWSPSDDDVARDAKKEEDILECLKPHKDLLDLTIFNYVGMKLPSWLTGQYLRLLQRLELSRLQISVIDSGVFPFLGALKLDRLPNLLQWFGADNTGPHIFPCLRFLWIRRCPELRNFPNLPSSLQDVENWK